MANFSISLQDCKFHEASVHMYYTLKNNDVINK